MKNNNLTLINNYTKENDFKYLGNISYDQNLENTIGNTDRLMNTIFIKDFKKMLFLFKGTNKTEKEEKK